MKIEEAIKIFEDWAKCNYEPTKQAAQLALTALRSMSETTKPGWISVKERLPEDDPCVKKHIEHEKFGFLTVLVYNGVVKQTNRYFSDDAKFGLAKTNGWEWASTGVTHWMPLPEPPEEG